MKNSTKACCDLGGHLRQFLVSFTNMEPVPLWFEPLMENCLEHFNFSNMVGNQKSWFPTGTKIQQVFLGSQSGCCKFYRSLNTVQHH